MYDGTINGRRLVPCSSRDWIPKSHECDLEAPWDLVSLITRSITSLIIGVTLISPLRGIIPRVISPVISGY